MIPPLKPGERPVYIVATGRDDPTWKPSERAIETTCALCGRPVMLDVASQRLVANLGLPVYCVACYARFPRKIGMRRA